MSHGPPLNDVELEVLYLWESQRPHSLRQYDQIPMIGRDLMSSVKYVAPLIANHDVAFMGDHDGVSVLLGLLAVRGQLIPPRRMTLLDFDERLLLAVDDLSRREGFSGILSTQLYNAFDAVPTHLTGSFDTFYTNPPYGASNVGESVRLFVTRGSELAPRAGSQGFIVLPYDQEREWTRKAMMTTVAFLGQHGWDQKSLVPEIHGYHLDDDPSLTSSLLTVKRTVELAEPMPWANRSLSESEIPHFYGRSERPPYPRYIRADGRPTAFDRAAS